ncbi:MAG TPA: TIM-barrel domain-containing protein, partial [Lentimicrobium sp.]|nr:TIM-barrel domain-containing protein [Lentimicrobium sp.]
EGENATYKQAKNVYGMMMAKSTFEGTKKLLGNKRPLILTRAGFSGLQRYTALWTGDNQATDEHMMLGARLVNSIGLSGVPFIGVDVGGFSKDATPALFARWMSLGAFTPFYRSHSHYDYKQAEPWSFGETVENICRNYVQFRYQMLPYLYSAFHQASVDGMPVARTLAIDYTFDEKVYWFAYQHQYLFGPSIMVAPVESTKDFVKVYLPDGDWYDFHTDSYFKGNSEILAECPIGKLPLYIKAGSLIPLQKTVQATSEPAGDTLFLHVYKGSSPLLFNYYEDDGVSYDYENKGYYTRVFSFDPVKKEIVLEPAEGNYPGKFKSIEVILHGFTGETFSLNGNQLKVSESSVNLLNALNADDPYFLENIYTPVKVRKFSLKNDPEKIIVKWK